MNIREHISLTEVAGYWMKEHWWNWRGQRKEEETFVPSRREVKRTLQYLDPETKEWEPLPSSSTYTYVAAPKECA